MTLETEDVTVYLQNTSKVKTLLEIVLKTDASKSLFIIITNDGYVLARTCPDAKYYAFDEHADTEKILIDTEGSRSLSSFRIVVVGIYGVEEERSGKGGGQQ